MGFRIFLTFLLWVFCQNSFGQNSAKMFQRAEEYSKRLSFAESIVTYESILSNPAKLTETEQQRAKLGLANASYLVKDYAKAEKYYREVLKNFPVLKDGEQVAYKRFAQVLATTRHYEEAGDYWKMFLELDDHAKQNAVFQNLYNKSGQLLRNQNSYEIKYLGINSGFPDFSPLYYQQGLVFVSGRQQTKAIKRFFGWDNSNFLDLYYLDDLKKLEGPDSGSAVLGTGGNNSGNNQRQEYFTNPTVNDSKSIGQDESISSQNYFEPPAIPTVPFSSNLNSKYHEGPAVFYNNVQNIIFTRNEPIKNSLFKKQKNEEITRLKLFSAELQNGKWQNIKELPFMKKDYSYAHPAITPNGRFLFFVSDMPGGFGGTDLYYTEFLEGSWAAPVNAGPKINTSGDEMFPYWDNENNLYFSSDGYPGLGSLDIYTVRFNLETKQPESPVRNLGAPINSQYDDFGIITDKDRTTGFFSSNRKRGGNDDDIYSFRRIGVMYGCKDLVVILKDSSDESNLANFKFSVEDISQKNSLETFTTKAGGLANICIKAEQNFKLRFEKDGYISKEIVYSNIQTPDYFTDTLHVFLNKEIPVQKIEAEKKETAKIVQKWAGNQKNSFRAIITDAEGNPVSNARVRFINKCTGEMQEMMSRKDGTVEFYRDYDCDYELISDKDGFTISRDIIKKIVIAITLGKKKELAIANNLFNTKLYRIGDVIRLQNIYYSSDEYKLNKAAKKDLDNLIEIMKKYPFMAIEITSHTDSRGNAQVNLALSQRRAKEVLDYLTKSIDKSRIRALGKGESEPVNNCSDGVQCTEAEYAKNRRTEFKILQMEKL